ncbi:hypothetical protein BMS3Abin05_02371 [bacterium BMS3Abin05]|nr:hypothetical protein BMS3Abin05_02371 [bacterium BMS3Abin05]GBE26696.1 hypothetical protein BMS3Bbin03_00615 [bacterium BMS3Bbin03]
MTFVKAERELGHDSRLVTLTSHPYGYEEDICLNLPFSDMSKFFRIKRILTPAQRLLVENVHRVPDKIPREWQPGGGAETLLIRFRERLWRGKIRRFQKQTDFWNFDVIQLDGGLEFYRDGRTVRKLKELGKKIICCYTGSDLRVRGVIPAIDASADLNVTVEFDHIYFHPHIQHVFFPFLPENFTLRSETHPDKIRIGHAPSNRRAKGTDRILTALENLKRKFPVEIVLIEGLSHREALNRKRSCALFVDQIGDLGYGINALEALAMGIPTATSLVKGFAAVCPDHPFIDVTDQKIEEKLLPFLEDPDLRRRKGIEGRRWLEKYHDARNVVRKIHQLAGIRS